MVMSHVHVHVHAHVDGADYLSVFLLFTDTVCHIAIGLCRTGSIRGLFFCPLLAWLAWRFHLQQYCNRLYSVSAALPRTAIEPYPVLCDTSTGTCMYVLLRTP